MITTLLALALSETSSEYALFDGQTVFQLSDQKKPAKFAAQKVKITGTLIPKTKTIKITTIDPAE
jgi:hypothetical protein